MNLPTPPFPGDPIDPAAGLRADDRHLDGNALAGPLSGLFVPDLTMAACRCGTCGVTGPLAHGHLYSRAPGNVLRCPHCRAATLRLVTAPGHYWLDMPAGSGLSIPAEPPG